MALSQNDLYNLAIGQGLTPARAKVASAVGMAESGGDPNQHNYNLSTGDDSWGVWQINMLGAMGPARRKQLGISDNSQLTDPTINARAMAMLSDNGGDFSPWSTYTTLDPNRSYRRFMTTDLTQTASSSSGGNWVDKILPGSPVSTAETFAQAFNKTAAWVSNSDNWVRIAYVAGGSIVILVGLSYMLSDTAAGRAITGTVPAGRAVKTVRTVKTASSTPSPGGAAPVKG